MSSSISPKLLKGAIVSIDTLSPPPQVIAFQYNPETLTRTIAPQTAAPGAHPGEALRLHGPPQESIRLEIELDATDALEKGARVASSLGVHTALAAIERLVYPGSAAVIANDALLRAGIMEVVPPMAPLTLFVWSLKRVLPVAISEFTILEEAFDPGLNPIRAKATLGLRVLTYQDLGLASPGGALFMAHQVMKEGFAIAHKVDSADAIAATAGGQFTSL